MDVSPGADGVRVALDAASYRGSLRVLVNPRGLLNVVNRVDLEEYLYGVVPAEMGPKRFDELEGLKAQAVAARTYALAHKGQFEAEGYDLCATPKCQVYAGLSAEDPLSSAAVDATRGLVLASGGSFADALFVSTCGGRTENVENVFGEQPVSVPRLGRLRGARDDADRRGAPAAGRGGAGRARGSSGAGYVLKHDAPRGKAVRAAALATAQEWAGVAKQGAPPTSLEPAAVYPSLVAAFDLETGRARAPGRDDRGLRLRGARGLGAPVRLRRASAYDFLLRFRFGAGEALPPADRKLDEEEYAGLLFSAALRLSGVSEGSGRFLSREGANLWVKTRGRADRPPGRSGASRSPAASATRSSPPAR